jgi:hypothetical protein
MCLSAETTRKIREAFDAYDKGHEIDSGMREAITVSLRRFHGDHVAAQSLLIADIEELFDATGQLESSFTYKRYPDLKDAPNCKKFKCAIANWFSDCFARSTVKLNL